MLGANDGLLSISSLLLGVAAAHMSTSGVLVTGLAGLVAGALSMGAGEYVSVSSQADTERADLELERSALLNDFDGEHAELRDIYKQRGLDHDLASLVSRKLMDHDALGAHARDEIGITDALKAQPLQAAATSAASFLFGGIVPLIAGVFATKDNLIFVIAVISFVFLAVLGALAARVGGASITRGAFRVLIWGAFVMGLTTYVGTFFSLA